MILTIQNQLNQNRSYLQGSFILSPLGTQTATSMQLYPLSKDASLLYDCRQQNVSVSDGVSAYIGEDAVSYLTQLASSLGSAVVGFIGSPSPSYTILVGSKDSNGNTQANTADALGNLQTSPTSLYTNITGNATTTIKSASGKLHGIILNNASTSGTIVLYDNTAGSGTKIGTLTIGSVLSGLLGAAGIPNPIHLPYHGTIFNTGLTIVTSGSSSNDITILYQ